MRETLTNLTQPKLNLFFNTLTHSISIWNYSLLSLTLINSTLVHLMFKYSTLVTSMLIHLMLVNSTLVNSMLEPHPSFTLTFMFTSTPQSNIFPVFRNRKFYYGDTFFILASCCQKKSSIFNSQNFNFCSNVVNNLKIVFELKILNIN